MIKNCFLADFLLKILIVSCLTLMFYSSEVRATGSSPDDDAEFMSEMNEFLRHPDEPDIYPDDHLSVSDSVTETQNTTQIPYNMGENAEDPGEQFNAQEKVDNRPEDLAVKLARPSDPEPEYPDEPETLSGKFIDIMEKLLESGGAVIVGVLVIILMVGLGMVKNRKKNTAPKPAVIQETAYPMEQSMTKYCTSCGSRLQPEVLFCTNCGEKI